MNVEVAATPQRWQHHALLFADTIARHSKSFSLAAKILPERTRGPVHALYTWCRGVDDAVDLVPAAEQKRVVTALHDWLRAAYGGERLPDAGWMAFSDLVHSFSIPVDYPRELLAGMEMDAFGTSYTTRDELMLYCYRVAGTVGLMMSHVMGVADPRALRHAAQLGMAMQLTNICRDVREDWERGRLYLPLELLPTGPWDVRGDPLVISQGRPALARAVRVLLDDADRLYRSADAGIASLSFRSALAVRSARFIYSAIGRGIQRRRYDVLGERVFVPGWRKAALLLAAGALEASRLPVRLLRPHRSVQLQSPLRYPDEVLSL
jgi:phytoene synthase